jgi:hypothetical protein
MENLLCIYDYYTLLYNATVPNFCHFPALTGNLSEGFPTCLPIYRTGRRAPLAGMTTKNNHINDTPVYAEEFFKVLPLSL